MHPPSLLTAGFVLLTAACSTAPVAQQRASASSIRSAEEMGAEQVPTAALHLQLAKEQYAAAAKEGVEEDEARRLLARAQADAELALALARTEQERTEANQAIEELNRPLPAERR